jgi:O-6-methylguanine DNA methyltransferase
MVACSFSDRSRREAERSVRSTLPAKFAHAANVRRADPSFRILYEFFGGNGKVANPRSLDLSNVSTFRMNVYKLLCKIPRGRVTTYGAIARRLGGKRYSRAVGTAVAKNPFPLIVPCHRVVPASGKVGNYGMGGREPSTGTYMKRRLLELEGVKFRNQKVSEKSMWVPPN